MKKDNFVSLTAILLFTTILIQNYTINIGIINLGLVTIPIVLSFPAFFISKYVYNPFKKEFIVTYFFLGYITLRSLISDDYIESSIYLSYVFLCYIVMFLIYIYTTYCINERIFLSILILINLLLISSIAIYLYLINIFTPEEISVLFSTLKEVGARGNKEITGYVTSESGIVRFNGFYFDPNYWALYATMSLTVNACFSLLYINIHKIKRSALFFIACITPSMISILLTVSRGALLSIFITSILILLILKITKSVYFLQYFTYLSITLIGIVFISIYYFHDVIEGIGNKITYETEAVENTRSSIWRMYIEQLFNESLENLMFGYGLKRDPSIPIISMSTHNIVLYLIVKLGIVGLFFYFMIIISFLRKFVLILYNNIYLTISSIGLLSVIIQSFFLDPLYHLPFWVLLGFNLSIFYTTYKTNKQINNLI